MRIAVSSNDGRVAPVFDWARDLVVIDCDGCDETQRQHRSLEGIAPSHRPSQLSQLDVEVLLCGGISAEVAKAFESKGIRVVAGLAGDVEKVLSAFCDGRLPDPALAMPGWRFMPSTDAHTGKQALTRHRDRGRNGIRRRGGKT